MLLDTPLCDFGWNAPDFTLRDPTGHAHTMQDYLGDKGLLIAFICNHCPYVKAIGERLAFDANTLIEQGIAVLAIMSNDYKTHPADNPENMTAFSKRYKFNFPYLIDEDQSVGKAYRAVCTPDFFGLNADGALHYRGRLDNLGMRDAGTKREAIRVRELVLAMEHIAETGHGPQIQTPSMGCSIKWQ